MELQTAFLTREPVFTRAELVAYLSERGVARPAGQAGLWLDHWQRGGTVVEIRRTPGLFSVVWQGVDPKPESTDGVWFGGGWIDVESASDLGQ